MPRLMELACYQRGCMVELVVVILIRCFMRIVP
jgi:hypothetical protein